MKDGKHSRLFERSVFSGLILGLIFIAFFGAIFLVRAVTPGTIVNPVFSPQKDDVSFKLECVTARYRKNNNSWTMYPSSSGKTYLQSTIASAVEKGGAAEVTCKTGWFMTGCSAACLGNVDPDEAMIDQNTCRGVPNGACTDDYTFIRCCKN